MAVIPCRSAGGDGPPVEGHSMLARAAISPYFVRSFGDFGNSIPFSVIL
jgi:hypothetical protein